MIMSKEILVGCIPNSVDFSHPADRRRYIPYFNKNNIKYELASFDKYYEYVYISIAADLGKWSKYSNRFYNDTNRPKVIFDLSDSYLSAHWLNDFLRSIYHFVSGRTKSFSYSYKKTIKSMIQKSDVLICGSIEQKNKLSHLHKNIFVIRDYFDEDINIKKCNYRLSEKGGLNILWEGFSHSNSNTFKMMRDVLVASGLSDIRLHVITDPNYCKIGAAHFCTSTYQVLSNIFSKTKIKFYLYDWNSYTFSHIASVCDFAIIPIPNDPIMLDKPENKLLLYWSIGLPVIATRTPSYSRVLNSINESTMACSTHNDWKDALVELSSSSNHRIDYMTKAMEYLRINSSEEVIMNSWDQIFTHV